MRLDSGVADPIHAPTAAQIAELFSSLPGGSDSFAVLLIDDLTYIQAHGSAQDGFVLEYQDGSLDQHYRAHDEQLDLAAVTRAFQQYAAGDSSWRGAATWQREEVTSKAGVLRFFVLAAIVAIVTFAIWRAS